ncbi:glycosyltransferase family 2 protein [Roseateles sp. LKC17W]|uniref:Glycosyltransferase family 2 protein n=1 Tax=Pelomonas margarita TaxID=3299031 RepID=A0ABW7FQ03_9BURK
MTAITLNWNGAADTIACVQALLASTVPPRQIVVCDNASRPESWQQLQSLQALVAPASFGSFASLADALAAPQRPRVVLIQTGANLGYAGGMNVGMRYALADAGVAHCWVLNNDTEVHPQALGALLQRSQAEPAMGICGATLLLHHARDRVQALGGASYLAWRARSAAIGMGLSLDQVPASAAAVEPRLAYVNGAAMLVRRELMETVGLMDERYFLYSEEHDWAYRSQLAGFKLGWAPDAKVFHKHGATIGTASSGGSPLSLFYLYRNKLAFARRFHPWRLWTVAPMLAWEAAKFALKGHPDKARAALRGLLAERRMLSYTP